MMQNRELESLQARIREAEMRLNAQDRCPSSSAARRADLPNGTTVHPHGNNNDSRRDYSRRPGELPFIIICCEEEYGH